jgi:hypothetical protein
MQFTFFDYRDAILYQFESSHLSQSFVLNQIGIQQHISYTRIHVQKFLDENECEGPKRNSYPSVLGN